MNISRFFIDRPIFAMVLSVVITIIGVFAEYFDFDNSIATDNTTKNNNFSHINQN